MNPTYRQTFSRHKVLFSLPAAIMLLFAIWFVLGTPTAYKASASLWVDTPAPGPSSLNNNNTSELTPAAQAQMLLGELLATRQFRLDIGHKSPLSKYYAQHSSEGWGPKGLLRQLRGSGSPDDRTAAALDPKHVLTAVAGPQVLGIELLGPTPVVTVQTLRALVATFNEQRRGLDVTRQQMSMAHYKSQMDAATTTLGDLNTRLAAGGLTPDQTAAATQAQQTAQTRLRTATRGYNQAALSLDAARGEGNVFRIIDEPKLPAPAVSGLKKSVFTLVAALFVGLLMSFVAIVLFTGSAPRRDPEIEELIARAGQDDEALDTEAMATNGEAAATNGSAAEQAPEKAERVG